MSAKSIIKNSFLSSQGQKTSGHNLVHLPIICQNLASENTFLANTRFTTSGTSTQVSSISTDIATLNFFSVFSFLKSFNSSSCLSTFEVITTEKLFKCGYISSKAFCKFSACF